MTDLTVRRARPDELDAVGDLTLRVYLADGYATDGQEYAATLADAHARARAAELLVAVDADDRLLGTVTVALPGSGFTDIARDGELEFRMLAVDHTARRRGVGEALVRAVLDRARGLGIPRVVMCSQPAMSVARRMYERLGFRRLPTRDWNPTPTLRLSAYELNLG